MKILLIGGGGMLGHKLLQNLSVGHDVYTTIHSEFLHYKKFGFIAQRKVFENVNVCDFEQVEKIIVEVNPEIVVNCVGIIKQKPTANDGLRILDINSIFPQRIGRISEKYNFKLLSFSTDCVFSGKKGNYTELDVPDAEDLYGKSKLLGEVEGKNCLTLRTSIIGRELNSKHSLIEWFISNVGNTVKGYKNAIYSGFPTVVMAQIICDIIDKNLDLQGLFHVSSKPISKYELLKLVKEKFALDIVVEPFEDFYIDRSLDSTKFRSLAGFKPLSWNRMIEIMADDPTPYCKWKR